LYTVLVRLYFNFAFQIRERSNEKKKEIIQMNIFPINNDRDLPAQPSVLERSSLSPGLSIRD